MKPIVRYSFNTFQKYGVVSIISVRNDTYALLKLWELGEIYGMKRNQICIEKSVIGEVV